MPTKYFISGFLHARTNMRTNFDVRLYELSKGQGLWKRLTLNAKTISSSNVHEVRTRSLYPLPKFVPVTWLLSKKIFVLNSHIVGLRALCKHMRNVTRPFSKTVFLDPRRWNLEVGRVWKHVLSSRDDVQTYNSGNIFRTPNCVGVSYCTTC